MERMADKFKWGQGNELAGEGKMLIASEKISNCREIKQKWFYLTLLALLSIWQTHPYWNGYCVTCAALKIDNLKLTIYHGTGERNHFH